MRDNIEIDIEKSYEELIISVSKHTTENMQTITTFRFYMVLQTIKKQHSKK